MNCYLLNQVSKHEPLPNAEFGDEAHSHYTFNTKLRTALSTMSTNDRYGYSPLSSTRHTRLILLHSSEVDNYPITCDLVETDIDEPPVYEALSYTWNNEKPSKPLDILVPGVSSGVQTLLVTTNCARALRILRKRLKPDSISKIGLWVDAVCINQACNEEKSAQVAMMAEIYRSANNVLVWLRNSYAPPNSRSMLILQLLRPFSYYNLLIKTKTWRDRWISKMLVLMEPFVSTMVKKGSKHLLPMFDSPYWSRGWTLQEFVHLSPKILCLSGETYPLRGGLEHLTKSFDSGDMWMHVQSLEWSQWEEYGAERPRLLSISLPQFLLKETADPRDKVFALRALFPDIIGDITVDYDRAVEDIFTEATIRLLGASRSLETLYTACVFKKSYKIPSWAVDWAYESELHQISDGAFREEED
ncbi:hypothetical protein E8E14_014564 [Neopestalotiopsis sp. 37M]|nr:hypothetical protein E8E14_014564 [Neopestalotiopsis sp. 37M]